MKKIFEKKSKTEQIKSRFNSSASFFPLYSITPVNLILNILRREKNMKRKVGMQFIFIICNGGKSVKHAYYFLIYNNTIRKTN